MSVVKRGFEEIATSGSVGVGSAMSETEVDDEVEWIDGEANENARPWAEILDAGTEGGRVNVCVNLS